MNYFFRGETDGFVFKVFSPLHILILITLLVLMILMYKYKNKFNPKIFTSITMTILLIDRMIMFYWYYTSGVLSLKESLPLFTCRTAIYLLLIYFITKNKFIKSVAIYWSLFGGIVAFIYPFMFAYKFPHYTNFSFFIYHMLLILLGFSIVIFDNYQFNMEGFKNVTIFTVIYLVLVKLLVVNVIEGSNYCYLRESPIFRDMLININTYLYSFIVISINITIFYIMYTISKLLQKKVQKLKQIRE